MPLHHGRSRTAHKMGRRAAKTQFDPRLHFAPIVEFSEDPIISQDLDRRIVSWNSAATHVFGYEAEEMMGQPILPTVPPDLHQEHEDFHTRLSAGERIDQHETVRVRKSGESFIAAVTIFPVTNDTGQIIGATWIVRDISYRKKSDETRFRLAAIVDSADDAIVSKDLNGIVKSWNEGARRMFGYTADEMVGQSILRIIPEELYYEEEEILRKLRAGERVDHYETTRRKKNGETIEVSVTISPIKDEKSRVIGASKIARDISDRKRIERLLVQSEKLAATGRMAAALAHEINNPLESVINLVFLARQDTQAKGKAHTYLLTAEEELERVSHIARQALGYYRDTGAPIEVYLHALIENVLTVYNSKIVSAGISVNARFNDLQKIVVSRGEMLQVLSNVIANAVDAMQAAGGVLHISTRNLISSAGDGIQIIIRDSGTGISSDHLPKVFDPFFTTKGNLGTGIGLWVAKQLVDARGGQISIASSSEKEKSGTTVTIFLPFAVPARQAEERPE